MTKEQLKRAVELNRSLKQLKDISNYLSEPCKIGWSYFRTDNIGSQGLEIPKTLAGAFVSAVYRCIKEVEEEIKEIQNDTTE